MYQTARLDRQLENTFHFQVRLSLSGVSKHSFVVCLRFQREGKFYSKGIETTLQATIALFKPQKLYFPLAFVSDSLPLV